MTIPSPVETDPHHGVARGFVALASGEAIARIVAFIATIVLAHRLGADGFGIIAFAAAAILYLSRIADVGIDLGIGIHEVAASPDDLPHIVPAILSFRMAVALALTVFTALTALAFFPEPEGTVLALYSLTLIPIALSTRWVLTGLGKMTTVAMARTAGELLMLLGVFVFVRRAEDLHRTPVAQLVGDLLTVTILGLWVRRRGVRLGFQWDRIVVRRLVARATPFVGSTLLGLMIFNADLLFLRAFADTATVGLYAAAYTLVSFLINIGGTYSLSLLPAITSLQSAPTDQSDLFQDALAKVFTLALPTMMGGMVIATSLIALVFGEEFLRSGSVLGILMISTPFTAMSNVPFSAILSSRKEGLILRLFAGAAIANTILNVVLIPWLGMHGAALATVLTEAMRFGVAMYYAHSIGFRSSLLPRLWRGAVATAAMGVGLLVLPSTAVWLVVPIGAALFGVTLFLVGGVSFEAGRWPTLRV